MIKGLTIGRAAALCLLVSAGLLIAVHVFEALGYVPCPLCLKQREVHWAAMAVAAFAFLLCARPGWVRLARIAIIVLAVVYLGSAVLAAYHAGVEYHWWPAPPCEAVGGRINAEDLLAGLEQPSRAVPCDEAAWRLFGVSMAGYNFLISLALAAVAVLGARPRQRNIFR